MGKKKPSHKFGSAGWLLPYRVAIDSMFGIVVEVSMSWLQDIDILLPPIWIWDVNTLLPPVWTQDNSMLATKAFVSISTVIAQGCGQTLGLGQ